MKKSLFVLSALGLASAAYGASAANAAGSMNGNDRCAPVPPAPCYSVDTCEPTFCLGPQVVNPAVRPCTCDGDFVLTLAGFYWNANQDGMEYAIYNSVKTPTNPDIRNGLYQINNLVEASYQRPKNHWDFGFKLGAGYNTTHDGWDVNVLWTWFRDTSSNSVTAESTDNSVILPLWSAYAPRQGGPLYATVVDADWRLQLNLIDIELGREMWMSKYLTFRPFVGVRIAFIDQDWDITHHGGSFSANSDLFVAGDADVNGYVTLDNDFKGAGLRAGFDTVWNFGKGWAFVGNFAGDLVYGRFKIGHEEITRHANQPYEKFDILQTTESFRAARGMLDLALGVQWATMFSECRYCFSGMLAWEQHVFFHQNQMWRVARVGDSYTAAFPNNSGENVFHQRRGTLSTQGWTLTFKFGF